MLDRESVKSYLPKIDSNKGQTFQKASPQVKIVKGEAHVLVASGERKNN